MPYVHRCGIDRIILSIHIMKKDYVITMLYMNMNIIFVHDLLYHM